MQGVRVADKRDSGPFALPPAGGCRIEEAFRHDKEIERLGKSAMAETWTRAPSALKSWMVTLTVVVRFG